MTNNWVKIILEVIILAKKRGEKERLPYHIVKDSQNQLKLKLKEITKQYARIPKKILSSGIIVLGILLVILVAVIFQRNQNVPEITKPPELLDVIVDDDNQLAVNLPPVNKIELKGLEILDQKPTSDLDEPAEMAVKRVDDSANVLASDSMPNDQKLQIIYPLRRKGGVVTEYGWYFHPILEKWSYHQGIDIRCQKGEIVMAAAAGKVTQISESYNEITLITIDHESQWMTIYGQIEKLAVKVGDEVVKGQKLGIIGQSTTALEPHLHFEIRLRGETVDPKKFI